MNYLSSSASSTASTLAIPSTPSVIFSMDQVTPNSSINNSAIGGGKSNDSTNAGSGGPGIKVTNGPDAAASRVNITIDDAFDDSARFALKETNNVQRHLKSKNSSLLLGSHASLDANNKNSSSNTLGIEPSRLLTRKSLNNLKSRPLRNTKNLSLNLNGISNNGSADSNSLDLDNAIYTPTVPHTSIPNNTATQESNNSHHLKVTNSIPKDSIMSPSPLSALPFRKASLKDNKIIRNKLGQSNLNSKISNQPVKVPAAQQPKLTRRRTMLSLSIPSNTDPSSTSSLSSAAVVETNPKEKFDVKKNPIALNKIRSSPNSPVFKKTRISENGDNYVPSRIASSSILEDGYKYDNNNVDSAASERTVLGDENSNYSENNLTPVLYNNNNSSSHITNNSGSASFSTQTILQDFSKLTLNDNFDENKLNAYPDGPVDIYDGKLFLYSEPTMQEILKYDVVINVAKEICGPFPELSLGDFENEKLFKVITDPEHGGKIYQKIKQGILRSQSATVHQPTETGNNNTDNKGDKLHPSPSQSSQPVPLPDYYYVPWTHTSKLVNEFPLLTTIIETAIGQNKRVLVHCQCGVSRSASLVIAYIMKLKRLILTEAYSYVKERANDISPNMTLIFQLMEWGDVIGCGVAKSPGYYDPEYNNQQVGEKSD